MTDTDRRIKSSDKALVPVFDAIVAYDRVIKRSDNDQSSVN